MTSEKTGSNIPGARTLYPSGLLYGALVLAAIAGVLHLYIGIVIDGLPMGLVLVLIALVYFGGIVLVAANYRRALWLKVGVGWVVLLLVLWALTAAINVAGSGSRDPLAFTEKVVEVVLLGVIVQLRMVGGKTSLPAK